MKYELETEEQRLKDAIERKEQAEKEINAIMHDRAKRANAVCLNITETSFFGR